MRFSLGICLTILGFAGAALGDSLILKDGTRVDKADFKITNGKITRVVKLSTGGTAEATVSPDIIASLDWGEPEQLTNARDLLSKGKGEEGIAMLLQGKQFFEPLQTIPGNWYLDIYLAYIDALNQAGKFEDVVRLLPDVQKLKLTDDQKMKLRILKLDIDRQTSSDYGEILFQAEQVLKETDDSAVGASVWMVIGDVHMKKKDYERALLSYLRIPVFFGTQVQKVPESELSAARALVKMKRYADAQRFFTRLAETYPGSAIALTAEKEKAAIGGMKNEDQEAPPGAAPAAGEKPAEAKPAEAKPAEAKPAEAGK